MLWAVERKCFGTITRLLENGADINNDRLYRTYKKNPPGWSVIFDYHELSLFTPLALAAALSINSMVHFLLDNGADIEKGGKGLCECCEGKNELVLSFPPIKGKGKWGPDAEFIMHDEFGLRWTPLHFALCRGYDLTAMFLLGRGANPRVTCPCKDGPWNALHTATRKNQSTIIDYLLDNNLVDINEAGHEGVTPFFLAFYEKNYTLSNMYLQRGADINAVWHSYNGGWTAFAIACVREDFATARELLRRGAAHDFVLHDYTNGSEWTALGLIYGNLFGGYLRMTDHSSTTNGPTRTKERRLLEELIIQSKVNREVDRILH